MWMKINLHYDIISFLFITLNAQFNYNLMYEISIQIYNFIQRKFIYLIELKFKFFDDKLLYIFIF